MLRAYPGLDLDGLTLERFYGLLDLIGAAEAIERGKGDLIEPVAQKEATLVDIGYRQLFKRIVPDG
jgi:hypothetical protein